MLFITKTAPITLGLLQILSFLTLPTQQRPSKPTKSSTLSSNDLVKRADIPSSFPTLHATGTDGLVYHVDVNIGTPPRQISLRVDIAQPYIWVLDENYYPRCANGVFNASDHCQISGAYDLNESSSAVVSIDPYRSFIFPDLVAINGTIIQEDIIQLLNMSTDGYYYSSNGSEDVYNPNYSTEHDNINITIPRFINVNSSNLRVGALGLAGPNSEDVYSSNDNALSLLSSSQFINSSGFSLYPKDAFNLDVILGGVNQSLYFEPFIKFDKLPYLDTRNNAKRDVIRYNYPIVPLTNVYVNNVKGSRVSVFPSPSGSTGNATVIPALLDTRATNTYLPHDLLIKLAIQLNAFYSSQSNSWFVKCSVGQLGASLGFQFGNVTVNVPISNFLTVMFKDDSQTSTVVFDDGSDACMLSIAPNTRFGYSILGTNVLQAMYLAVDNANDQVAIAQANNAIYSRLNNTHLSRQAITTTNGPFYSSIIQAQGTGIPFAQTNNITDLVSGITFTSKSLATNEISSFPAEITALYSSGRIITGDPNGFTFFTTATPGADSPNAGTNTASQASPTNTMSAAAVDMLENNNFAISGIIALFMLLGTLQIF